jgi:2-dehydropantoate 2-reductase
VYPLCVVCPTTLRQPGVVQAHSSPLAGVLDIGRYPEGVDDTARDIATVLASSSFSSEARPDIMSWKYTKLLTNLGHAVEAVCGASAKHGVLGDSVWREGEAVLAAAEIDHPTHAEFLDRQRGVIRQRKIRGQLRAGGSTWQTLARGSDSLETDYLNGEIVREGARHGVPTPVNAAVQQLVVQMARDHAAPGSVDESEVLERLGLTQL